MDKWIAVCSGFAALCRKEGPVVCLKAAIYNAVVKRG